MVIQNNKKNLDKFQSY